MRAIVFDRWLTVSTRVARPFRVAARGTGLWSAAARAAMAEARREIG